MKKLLLRILLCLLTLASSLAYFALYPTEVKAATLTLRPSGQGDESSIGGANDWQQVDEDSPDGLTTYVYSQGSYYVRDVYALPNYTTENGAINSVTVYAYTQGQAIGKIKLSVRTVSTTYDSAEYTMPAYSWEYRSQAWSTNPNTGSAWTWTQIDALQAGINIHGLDGDPSDWAIVTQVYVVVDYTPTAPTVTLSAATLVTATTATINGSVTSTGGENPTVTQYWGDNDGGTTAGNWDNNGAPTSPGQPQGVASFYKNISSLSNGVTYYFSAKATNSVGTGWPAASLSFVAQNPSVTWYDTSYLNRKQMTINGTVDGNQNNYQIQLNVYKGIDDTSGVNCYKAVFSMTASANSYQYSDLSNIANYVIQSGDYLEYDIYWTGATDYIGFDYTTTDNSYLRGNANDQNGLGAHPATNLSAYALNTWYSRKIALPAGHVGKTISYYDIASESDITTTKTSYFKNIGITDGAGTTRKLILTGTEASTATTSHLSSYGSLSSFARISPSANVYLNNKVQDDFDDIRFTKNDGVTLLDYWTESYTSGTSAVVWVEFDSISASPSTTNFYLYYNSASAISASNGDNTFPLFDDFNDGSINTNKWNVIGTATENGSTIVVGGGSDDHVTSVATFGQGYSLRARAQFQGARKVTYVGFTGDSTEALWRTAIDWNGNYFHFYMDNTSITYPSVLSGDENFHLPMIKRYSSNLLRLYDNITQMYEQTNTAYIANNNMFAHINAYSGLGACTTTVDWLFISKVTLNEPTWGVWGIEETAPALGRSYGYIF